MSILHKSIVPLLVAATLALALAGAPLSPAQADWPPLKVDLAVQQDGNMFTAVVWLKNEGDFDTDVMNVKGRVPAGAKYVDSWAGSGRGFNAGVFDGNDVGWINGGIKAGARQGPFVYVFDGGAMPARARPSVSAWVSWAGKVPGTAVSTVAAGTAPSEVLTRLDSAIGAPPAVGWKWQVMRRTIGPADVAEDTDAHGNSWVFYVLKGSTEVGIGDGKELLRAGEATLIQGRQDHTHLFPAQSEILGFQVRPGDRPPGDSHRGQLLFTSEETIEAPAGNYSVRVREFTLARGEEKEANVGTGPFAYVIDGTLSTRSGSILSTTDAGKVLGLPSSGTVVVSNEGTTLLKFILVDLHPQE